MQGRQFRKIAAAMLLLAMVACSGCFAYLQDDGEVQVSLSTTLTLKQIGPKDINRQSLIGLDAPDWMQRPIVGWIIDSDGDGVADMSGDGNETPND